MIVQNNWRARTGCVSPGGRCRSLTRLLLHDQKNRRMTLFSDEAGTVWTRWITHGHNLGRAGDLECSCIQRVVPVSEANDVMTWEKASVQIPWRSARGCQHVNSDSDLLIRPTLSYVPLLIPVPRCPKQLLQNPST